MTHLLWRPSVAIKDHILPTLSLFPPSRPMAALHVRAGWSELEELFMLSQISRLVKDISSRTPGGVKAIEYAGPRKVSVLAITEKPRTQQLQFGDFIRTALIARTAASNRFRPLTSGVWQDIASEVAAGTSENIIGSISDPSIFDSSAFPPLPASVSCSRGKIRPAWLLLHVRRRFCALMMSDFHMNNFQIKNDCFFV